MATVTREANKIRFRHANVGPNRRSTGVLKVLTRSAVLPVCQ
jgi:hypothetical protein